VDDDYEVCLKIKRSDCIEVLLCDERGVPHMAPIKLQMGDTIQIEPFDRMVSFHIGYGRVPRERMVAYLDDLLEKGQNALTFGEFMYGTDEEGAFDDVEFAMRVLSRLKERLTCTSGCVNVDGLV
jgi:hypothetical protein